jgi:hypothetical protein
VRNETMMGKISNWRIKKCLKVSKKL